MCTFICDVFGEEVPLESSRFVSQGRMLDRRKLAVLKRSLEVLIESR